MSQSEVASTRVEDKNIFGFWVYLMTDCVLFASLFATFAVLRNNISGGPAGQDIFSLPFVLAETLILLTSSFICGLALLAAREKKRQLALALLGLVFILGAAFLTLEIREFSHLYHQGNGWRHSAFLTSFFTLVGTHGAHISAGLIWLGIMMGNIYYRGISAGSLRKLTMFAMFWHFLDLVWIFIFTIVYLMGIVQ